MNYLTALVAFSAIMIVLATLATVVVEGLHKLFRQRAKDFEEMLANLFEKSIKPRMQSVALDALSDAQTFARQIVKNPAFMDKDKGFFRKLPIFNTDFDELSTQQFVEQLAQTDIGKELKTKISNGAQTTMSTLIEEVSADFERFGEAATSYFQRRAHVLSVLVAFVLAFTINIDALRLYSTLARDTALSEKIVSEINVNDLQQVYEQQIASAEDEQDKQAVNETYAEIRDRIRADASKLEELGLPIGHSLFPYCTGSADSDSAQPEDTRCIGVAPVVLSDEWKARLGNFPIFVEGLVTYVKAFFVRSWLVITSQQGIAWLFSAALAGGLIGLGAPFWFKTYRFLANFIPGFKAGSTTQLREDTRQVRVSQQPVRETQLVHASEENKAVATTVDSANLSRSHLYDVFLYAVPEQNLVAEDETSTKENNK